MNVALNPQQSDTKAGAFPLKATADLTGLEGRLVRIANSGGVAKFALPATVLSFALFLLASGDVAANDNWAEQPESGGNFRVRLNGTCVPGDVLVLCDPAASSGVNAGKVEALGTTEGAYFAIGVAQQTGADEQLVLARYAPRIVHVGAAFTVAAPAATAATSTTPFGFSEAQANAILTNLIEVRAFMVAQGWKATS